MFHRTERLLLRPFWAEDAQAVYTGINNPLILKNLSSPPSPFHLADAEEFCARHFNMKMPSFALLRRTSRAPTVIGSMGLGPIATNPPHEGAVQIGYWVAQPYWGLGYATEAARAVLSMAAMLGHRQIYARHFADNTASGRVLRKLGFQPTGRPMMIASNARQAQAPGVELVCDPSLAALRDGLNDGDADVLHAIYNDSIDLAA